MTHRDVNLASAIHSAPRPFLTAGDLDSYQTRLVYGHRVTNKISSFERKKSGLEK